MVIRLILGIIIGGGFGATLGYFGKCSSGACPLTANPYRGALFGAVIGAVLMSMYSYKETNRENNREKGNMVISIGSKEAFEKILQSKGLYIVDFYATWCAPCGLLSPVLEKLSETYKGRVTFVKVDVTALAEIAQSFKVTGTPTVVFIKDGSEVQRLVGLRVENEYAKVIDKSL